MTTAAFLNVVGDPLPFSGFDFGLSQLPLGICCGLVSTLYIYLVTSGPGWAKQEQHSSRLFRPLVAATILFAISPFFPQLIGPGMPSVNMAIGWQVQLGTCWSAWCS